MTAALLVSQESLCHQKLKKWKKHKAQQQTIMTAAGNQQT